MGGELPRGVSLAALAEAARLKIAERTEAGPPARILLYVDQGEELYARSEAAEARRFSELLAEAAGRDGIAVMTSLRADYYGRLQDDAALFPACDRLDIPPLGRHGLEAVIRKPVDRLGARFEDPGIVPVIAEAAARQSGALPLLSFMMTEAWDTMRQDKDSGGVLRFPIGVIDLAGPLVQRAELFLDQHPHDHDTLHRLFTLRLVHVPKEGEPVRRRAARTECSDKEWVLAQELASADWRLLTAGSDDGNPTVEVAHETLLRTWPRLTAWIGEERAFLIRKGQLEANPVEWEAAPPDKRDEAVLMGLALATAERWHAERKNDLSKPDAAFIGRSLKLEADRKSEQHARQAALAHAQAQAERRRQWLTHGAMAAAMVCATLLGVAVWQWSNASSATDKAEVANRNLVDQLAETQKAQEQADQVNKQLELQLAETRKEQVRVRASTAEALSQRNLFDAALAVAVAAFPPEERDNWANLSAYSGIWTALAGAWYNASLRTTFRGHQGEVTSASFSADGIRVVTASLDRTARIWDAADGALIQTLTGHEDEVQSAGFSPDGTRVVTASLDRTARVWDAADGALIHTLTGHEEGVTSAGFSPDGTRIVTASGDRTARVWDAADGALIHTLAGHEEGVVYSATFSPDGTRIVTASSDRTVRVWKDLPLVALVDHARARVERAQVLGIEEQYQYFLRVEECS